MVFKLLLLHNTTTFIKKQIPLIAMDTKILKEIGLTDNEIKVYLIMLEEDENLASTIADKTKINRSLMYTILNNLIEKGMASYVVKENRKYFRATDPEKILNILKEKEELIKKQEEAVKNILPDLRKLKLPREEEVKVEIYKGKEGNKTLLDDILRVGEDYLCLGYSGLSLGIIPYYFMHWHKRRVKIGIKRKIITKEQMRDNKAMKWGLTSVRYVPDELNIPISTMIYGNKVWTMLPSGKNDQVSILIESKDITNSYRNYFNLLWKIAKK